MAAYRMGKDLHQLTSDRGLISNIYKELKKLDIKIANNSILKWGTDINRDVSTKESQIAKRHARNS